MILAECEIMMRPLRNVDTDDGNKGDLSSNHFLLCSTSGTKLVGIQTDDPEVLKLD